MKNGTPIMPVMIPIGTTRGSIISLAMSYAATRKGEVAYGHEFHYSRTETPESLKMENIRGNGINGRDVLCKSNTQASYSHFSLARYGRRLQSILTR